MALGLGINQKTTTFTLGGSQVSLKTEAHRNNVDATITTGEGSAPPGMINELQAILKGFTENMRGDLDCRIGPPEINDRAICLHVSGAPTEAVTKYLAGLPDYLRANWTRRSKAASASAGGSETSRFLAG